MTQKRAIWHAMIAAISVGAAILPQAAFAITPPLGPPQYSAYGPFQLCSGRFVIDINTGEALHVVGDIARIINDQEVLAIKYANAPDYYFPDFGTPKNSGKAEGEPKGNDHRPFSIRRVDTATPDAARSVRYAPHGLSDKDVRYALTQSDNVENPLIVGATSFDGSQNDQRLLARIKHPNAGSANCLLLSTLFNRDHKDAAYKRAYELSNDGAAIIPPVPDQGPLFHCTAGLGFALEAGESLHRPWRPLGEAGNLHINTAGSHIKIEQRFYNAEKPRLVSDPTNPTEHPMRNQDKTRVTYYPSRGIGPPYSEPGVREPGSWAVKLIESYDYGVTFSFPASEYTGAGFRFLERLQFVAEDDRRCLSGSNDLLLNGSTSGEKRAGL
ncbi:MAG: hypothetical protein ABL928_11680 [Sphingorhabdus sp.]